jgi:hypothetical protein
VVGRKGAGSPPITKSPAAADSILRGHDKDFHRAGRFHRRASPLVFISIVLVEVITIAGLYWFGVHFV